jgi:hypothetical protein
MNLCRPPGYVRLELGVMRTATGQDGLAYDSPQAWRLAPPVERIARFAEQDRNVLKL